ncbi:hypothetical protein PO909_009984 [Leuciscus waleckii]
MPLEQTRDHPVCLAKAGPSWTIGGVFEEHRRTCGTGAEGFSPAGYSSLSSMFGKKKKRLEISAPSNFEHRVHTGFDPQEQRFTGLPSQWQSLLADTANRPRPVVDPSYITPIQLAPMKVLTLARITSCSRSHHFLPLWPSHPSAALVLHHCCLLELMSSGQKHDRKMIKHHVMQETIAGQWRSLVKHKT